MQDFQVQLREAPSRANVERLQGVHQKRQKKALDNPKFTTGNEPIYQMKVGNQSQYYAFAESTAIHDWLTRDPYPNGG